MQQPVTLNAAALEIAQLDGALYHHPKFQYSLLTRWYLFHILRIIFEFSPPCSIFTSLSRYRS